MIVDVRSGSSFTNVGSPDMGSEDDLQNLRNNPSYQPGGPGAVVTVRLIYEWPLYLDLGNLMNLSQLGNKKRVMVATTVFGMSLFLQPPLQIKPSSERCLT